MNAKQKIYAAFAQQFPYCWACGIGVGLPAGYAVLRDGVEYSRNLEICHILGGSARVHQRLALWRGCQLCHRLSEATQVRAEDGELLPRLTLANVLWLKRDHDRPHYRPDGLRALWWKNLPGPELPPEWFRRAYRTRHPRKLTTS